MTRPVRLRDVAALADTSTKTASRILNGDARVGAEIRARVERAIVELDYRPDPLARSLRLGTDDTIGVVVDEVGDPFFASAIAEIERVTLDRGVTVIIASTRRLPDRERIVLDGLLRRRVAGLIIASVCDDHRHLRAASCPVVFMDRAASGLEVDTVLVDDRGGARMAVEHLIAHGHRRIAYVGDRMDVATISNRLEGYREALAAAGIPPREEYVVRLEPTLTDAGPVVGDLLGLPEPPTAVFSANTRCSLRILAPLHATGRTDLALVSFGDFAMAAALAPPVTVVDHSPEAIGRLAADRLLQRMNGDSGGVRTVAAPLHLVPRGSGEIRPRTRGASVHRSPTGPVTLADPVAQKGSGL